MKHLFFAIMMLPFMVACSSSDNDIVTDVEGESETNAVNSNILGLTNMVFYLPEDGDTVTIPVGEDGWHIEEIIVNDSEGNAVYNMSAEEQNRLSEEGLYEGSFRDWLTIKCEKNVISIIAQFSYEKIRDFSFKVVKGGNSVIISGSQKGYSTGDTPGIIHVSTDSVAMNANESSVFISSAIDYFWIPQFKLNGKTYSLTADEINSSSTSKNGFVKKQDWLTVKRLKNGIMIAADKNEGEKRSFSVMLQVTDYFCCIKGTQEGLTDKK